MLAVNYDYVATELADNNKETLPMRTTWKISTSVTIITVGKYYRTHTPLNSKLEIPPEYIQGLKQDFSGGGGVQFAEIFLTTLTF